MGTDGLETVLTLHQPWYDSFDQNSDSWGCTCDKRTGYRTASEVVKNHIVPLVRRTVATRSADLLAEGQRQRGQQRPRRAGRAADAPPPDPFTDFWCGYEAHVALMEKHGFHQTAAILKMYEQERQRQKTAIGNLEDQLAFLVNMSLDQSKIRDILARAGMDLDVLIQTDEVFGEKPDDKKVC